MEANLKRVEFPSLEYPFQPYYEEEGEDDYSYSCTECGNDLTDEELEAGHGLCIACFFDEGWFEDVEENITLHPVEEEREKLWLREYPFAEEKIDVVRAVWHDLQSWAGLKHPEEIGGLMFSHVDDRFVTGATLLRNAKPEAVRTGLYSPDPQEFIRQLNLLESRGYKVVGWWHSHPSIPAVPSWTDMHNHKHPFKMFIFSVSDQQLRAYDWDRTQVGGEPTLKEYKVEVV